MSATVDKRVTSPDIDAMFAVYTFMFDPKHINFHFSHRGQRDRWMISS